MIQTVITLIIAIPLSYVMARAGSKVRSFLLIVVILPLMTSVVVRTFGWVVLMGPSGLLMKIPGAEFLVGGTQGFLGTETGVVIAMVQVLLPFAVLSILGVVSGIRPQLEEAARTLGAGFWRTLWHVVLPLSRSRHRRRSLARLRPVGQLVHHAALHRRGADPGVRPDHLHRRDHQPRLVVRGRTGRAAVRRGHARARSNVPTRKQKV